MNICWDMDGTIADTYAVKDWLNLLNAQNPAPYIEAQNFYDPYELYLLFEELHAKGFTLEIITWLSRTTTPEYNTEVRAAKRNWLKENGIYDCFDSIHMVKYGTPKHLVSSIRKGILVDDNANVREKWVKYGGTAIDPRHENIFERLRELC